MFIQDIPSGQLLYIMLYGGAAMAALIAFVYLLLRRGNAFAPDVTPPLGCGILCRGVFGPFLVAPSILPF